MAKLTVTELEVLFTADTSAVDKAAKEVKDKAEQIEKKPVKAKVTADTKGALGDLDKVDQAAKKIVSAKTIATVDANVERAEKQLARAKERLDYLRSVETDLEVTADIKRAETNLKRLERNRDGLVSARSKLEVDADTTRAQKELESLEEAAKRAGESGGDKAGRGLTSSLDSATRGAGKLVGDAVGGDISSTLESALTAIPIAGGIVLAATAIGKAITGAIQAGMSVEVGRDRLQALTGISEKEATKLSMAAGEAYVNAFGSSIEANMDAAKLGVQFQIIDPKASTRAAQETIQSLSGIADVLGEDVRPTAQAVSVMLSSGIASSAQEAFDVLAAGAREGVNRSEDLLDTYTEYPALFKRLGLDGQESLGLINQAMQAGARNSDVAADALKEFQIRATDGSKTSAAGFQELGLNAEQMTAQIAKGGTGARKGLQTILDKLREMNDPVKQNAAAVALFGTKAEDLGKSLFAMDLSTAVKQMNGVKGAAEKMFDTLADNDATKIEGAKRSIEVAVQGVQGALAGAFAEPLGDFADWVSANRGPLLQFFQDLVNGAIDFAQSANTGIGDFVSGPLAAMVDGLVAAIKFFKPFEDTSDLDNLSKSMRDMSDVTDNANTKLEEMRGKFNGFAEAQVTLGYLSDASKRTAQELSAVGVNADGSAAKLKGLDVNALDATASGRDLASALQGTSSALGEQLKQAAASGEGQKDLKRRYDETEKGLRDQLKTAGLTKKQIDQLVDSYLSVPKSAVTTLAAKGTSVAKGEVERLRQSLASLPKSQQTRIKAILDRGDLERAKRELNYIARDRDISLRVHTKAIGAPAKGATVASAAGNYFGDIPNGHMPEIVGAGVNRVFGEPETQGEAYVPLADDWRRPRAESILAAVATRFGMGLVRRYAAGGINVDSGTAGMVAALNVGALPLAQLAQFGAALKSATAPIAGLTTASKSAASALASADKALSSANAAVADAEKRVAAAEAVKPDSALGKALSDLASAQKAVDPKSSLGKARERVRDAEDALAAASGKKDRDARQKALDAAQAALQKKETVRDNRIERAQEKADYLQVAHDKALASAQAALTKAQAKQEAASAARDKADKKAAAAADKLAEAQDKQSDALDDLKAAQQALADSARSASESLQSIYLTGGDTADLLQNMNDGSQAMSDFANLVERLRQSGLDESVIQEIIRQGVEVGSETATDILAGGKESVDALNSSAAALKVIADKLGLLQAAGQVQYAAGGIHELTPMSKLAQVVPASTWRVVGDRADVPELYAPLDGSARSWALLMEGFRRMPGSPPVHLMGAGGLVGAGTPGAPATYQVTQHNTIALTPKFKSLIEELDYLARNWDLVVNQA